MLIRIRWPLLLLDREIRHCELLQVGRGRIDRQLRTKGKRQHNTRCERRSTHSIII